MRILYSLFIVIFLASCVSKYKASHSDREKFNKDVADCLKKSCASQNKNMSYKFSLISSSFAYGGGGVSTSLKNNMSYKTFSLCLENKGYFKDENGVFELPNLSCR